LTQKKEEAMNATHDYPELALHVGGRWITHTDAGVLDVIDPASGDWLAALPLAGADEAAAAFEAAGRAQPKWAALSPLARQQILVRGTALLRERAARIAHVMTQEQGKPLAESEREVLLAADIIDFLAEEARRQGGRLVPPRGGPITSQSVHRVPVGPVAAFTPWNFPINLPARKLGGALAAGCTVVLKPAEETPASAQLLVQALLDGGLPDGVLNLLFGHPAQVSAAAVANPWIAKLSFTGSTAVGRSLAAQCGQALKRFTGELGGHAPVIVCDDADVPAAVAALVSAKFRGAGQVCTAPTRLLVQRRIHAAFTDAFVAAASALRVGPGLQPGVQMGPLIAARRVEFMQVLVDDAVALGGTLLCGGKPLPGSGFFYPPTVLADVPTSARAQREEPFGPLAMIDAFDDIDEALTRANALPQALAAYAFTRDLQRAHRLGQGLRAGMVGINHCGLSQPETPFGGQGDSGIGGSESGLEGLLSYTETRLLSVAA